MLTNNYEDARTSLVQALACFDRLVASQIRQDGSSPNGPGADHDPVDLNHLEDLTDHQPQKLRELVAAFVAEVEETMDGLGASIDAGDWDQTEALAHRLSGTSATCGMVGLVTPLHDLELLAKVGGRSSNQALFREARYQQARTSVFLESCGLGKRAMAREADSNQVSLETKTEFLDASAMRALHR
jgi:HPt (histidine-containing phosphotransfer) domain-containing protein